MRMNLGTFKWESGSINDNIRNILKEKSIGYLNTFNGDILAEISGDKVKVKHEMIESNTYRVYVEN